MGTASLILLLGLNLVLLALVVTLLRRSSGSSQSSELTQLARESASLRESLTQKFSLATADMAQRLESTKGDLRQEVTDRLGQGFSEIRTAVEDQLAGGRREQTQDLRQARTELTTSLALTTSQLKVEFDNLNQKTAQNLEMIRERVDAKLLAITDQVQQKLDQNIKEGFAHFEKVQQHLKAAEEQLREVGALGHSINDLNNLLKLPHLRGQFGEASLERLLADFLPAHMFEMQASPGDGSGRADAVIQFPDRRLPIDAKFPRESVLALFEGGNESEIEDARHELVRVMKAEAKRIKAYIQPEHGTTDIALMYLPSETLYMEAIRNRELADWLNAQHVFPVSPNTLLMTLQTIALVHKWYEVASRFEKSRLELAKAQKSFDHFQNQFETVGKNLNKAQEAFETAQRHLKTYRGRVTVLSGQEQLELDAAAATAKSDDAEGTLPLADKASA
ncbi:MAG TPA: DNA recombination protein RmuC [Terriglobales bacterium]|jgi:DNA recombination protein RmuC|nr:DNA recombination protein RmuC [Terriglobales bacterium]